MNRHSINPQFVRLLWLAPCSHRIVGVTAGGMSAPRMVPQLVG